tara:strand:- start:2139 stop:3374 length:1236 start_codon:yes stop_codon:yes gene_type:complete
MKIIGFDSWLGGFRNFKRLRNEFQDNNVDFNLIHLSSWSGTPFEEKIISNLISTDISKFNTLSFDKILKIEKPAVVVFLSTDVFAHKSMIRACRRNNIPTIHLFHGIMSVLSVNEKVSYSKSLTKKIYFAIPRILKYFKYIVPNYFISMYLDKITFKDIYIFLKTLVKLFNGHNIKKQNHDSRTDLAIVFNHFDADYAINKFGYSLKNIKIVGSPDLYEFSLKEDELNIYQKYINKEKDYVLYLDSVPFLRGLTSPEENYNYLLKINKKVISLGKILAIKLHPEHKKTEFSKKLSKAGVKIVDKNELISIIKNSEFVISEATSLFQIPALMGWPIYISIADVFSKMSYGEVITSYPNTFKIKELREIGGSQLKIIDSSIWIKNNCGPKPFSGFNSRVFNEIKNISNESISR